MTMWSANCSLETRVGIPLDIRILPQLPIMMIRDKGAAMTLNPSGYGGLLNPYQQLEKYGYHLVSINPEMKVADMSHVLRQVVLDYLDALAHMNSERHAEQARAYF